MNKIKLILNLLLKFVTIFVVSNYLFAKNDNINNLNQDNYVSTTQVTRTMSNISNWGYWINYDGKSGNAPNSSSGGIYPRGTAGVIYQDGFVWGGKIDTTGDGIGDDVRVGGQTYNIGTQPGWINDDGSPADITDSRVKVYRIRSDWIDLYSNDVRQDAMELNELSSLNDVTWNMIDDIIDQYREDWNEWPVDLGAPWVDMNNNGVYDSYIDIAGIAGADQVIWLVVNDLDSIRTLGLYGSLPIGLELQITIWAYEDYSRLGQAIFKRYKLINKSNNFIEDMYVSQWSDPDLGDYGDDFCGCDTVLSIGYAYNGNEIDSKYNAFGLVPAAVGYDFLQGPIVESFGDTAIFDLKKKVDYKNLGMTSFAWFSAVSDIGDPVLGYYQGTKQWYNMLRGYKPFDDLDNPSPWTEGNYTDGTPTKFPLSGDPVTGTGFIDGKDDYFKPGDRRIALNSGPFNMAPGDTQEVVIALVGGLGGNRLMSVNTLKETDVYVQKIYDNLFASHPQAPDKPLVEATSFENKILLEWGFDSTRTTLIENSNYGGYKFEGYNIYQLPSEKSNLDEATRIATYDIINNVTLISSIKEVYLGYSLPEFEYQYGTDSGIKRFLHLERNQLKYEYFEKGRTYYFAVTAYNYNDEFQEKFYESQFDVISVTVQDPLPGNSVPYSPMDTIGYSHTQGSGEGEVLIKVINPTKTTGHDYEIFFTHNIDSTKILWNVNDVTADSIVVSDQKQISDNDDQPIFDGLQVKVLGPNPGCKSVVELDANDVVVDEGVTSFADVNIAGPSLGSTGYLLSNIAGLVNQPPYEKDWDRFGYWGTDDIVIDFGQTSLTWDYSTETVHFDSLDDSPYYAPFAVYRIIADGNTYRLFAGFLDSDGDGTWNNNGSDWSGPIYGAPSYEPIYCWQGYDASGNDINYNPANDAQYVIDNKLETSANTTWGDATGDFKYPYITAMLFTEYLGGPPIGNKISFITNKTITTKDKYTFSTIAPKINDIELAKIAAEKINVYPNPFYAHNPLATEQNDEYVTFTHLPAHAKISIYTLTGVLITKIIHDDPTSQFKKWDLTNGQNMLVASGLYIAFIELPDLKMTKTLKFFIIQRELNIKSP